jgi:DNA-binding transcriptional regulator GbsR (MarR family)
VAAQSDRRLDAATSNFIEAFGQLVSDGGLSPSVGRVLGLLVIYEEHKISAEELGNILRLSAGSVNSALNLLAKFGYVKRTTVPGERRFYYEFEAGSWQRAVDTRLAQMKKGIEVANAGLEIRGNDPRLIGMRSLYDQMYEVVANVHVRLA